LIAAGGVPYLLSLLDDLKADASLVAELARLDPNHRVSGLDPEVLEQLSSVRTALCFGGSAFPFCFRT
jgi:hypothetical protein